MKVIYKEPKDKIKYSRWMDDNGLHDIWYERPTSIYHYKDMNNLPSELVLFLDKWSNKINGYIKDYKELYPVKLAHIIFIYKDIFSADFLGFSM